MSTAVGGTPRVPAALAGPLSLIGASFLLAAGGLTVPSLSSGLIALAAVALALWLVTGARAFDLRRLLPGLLVVLSVTWSNWFLAPDHALEPALLAGVRIAYFVWPSVVAAGFVDPSALGDHLGQRLRLPARPVLAVVAAMQRLDALGENWTELDRARRIRGLAPGRGLLARVRHVTSLSVALLVEALRGAQVLSFAMDARGYRALGEAGARRTWAAPAPWRGVDTVFLIGAGALAALPTALHSVLG